MILARLKVAAISRPSPSFIRLELAGPELAEFGVDGPLFDQRFKLLMPGPAGLPELNPETWWADFQALPAATRGAIRTYTIADVVGTGAGTRIVLDVVLHPGAHGPGSAWAIGAELGDEVLAALPKKGAFYGGIEFAPASAARVLLVGDETALPAVVQILRELPEGLSGSVFLEVPLEGDVVELPLRDEIEVTWLPRNGAAVGDRAVEAVGADLGFRAEKLAEIAVDDLDVDPDLWETPVHSSSGESLESEAIDDRYAWIAGESSMVTRLRRHLVGELGMPRAQVAFMGYWREGVAMRG